MRANAVTIFAAIAAALSLAPSAAKAPGITPDVARIIVGLESGMEVHRTNPGGTFDVFARYHGMYTYNAREQKAGHSIKISRGKRRRTIEWANDLRTRGARRIYLVSCEAGNYPYVEIDLRTGRTIPWPPYIVRDARRGPTTRNVYAGLRRPRPDMADTREDIDDLRVLRGMSQARVNRLLHSRAKY